MPLFIVAAIKDAVKDAGGNITTPEAIVVPPTDVNAPTEQAALAQLGRLIDASAYPTLDSIQLKVKELF